MKTLRVTAYAACVAALVATHAPLIAYRAYANVDEAYAAALAERLNEGYRLYDGAVSQRGPLFYYAWAVLARVAGWDNVTAVRVCALLAALAQVMIVGYAAQRFVSRRAGVLAALLEAYALVAGLPAIDGMALHAESLQATLLVGGAALGVLDARRGRWSVALVAGLLFGAAFAIKPSSALQPLPTLAWIFLAARRARRSPWRPAISFVVGVALVPLAFLLHAAANGTLHALLFYTVTYNLGTHLRPEHGLLPKMSVRFAADDMNLMTSFVVGAALVLAAIASVFLGRVRAAFAERSLGPVWRGLGMRSYFSVHFAVATLPALALARFFPHYFVPAVAFLSLALAAWCAPLLVRVGARAADWLVRAAILALLAVTWSTAFMNEKLDGRVMHDALPVRIGHYVEATTDPEAKIFVWGFSPWIYAYSHRRPASRFVFATYVTGLVPWFYDALPDEAARAVPGAMQELVGDLEREQPEVVVDAGSVEIARPLRAYPPIAAWLESQFCFEVRVGAYDIYRRRHEATCATTKLPLPHAPFDFVARSLHVPVPELPPGTSNAHALCQPRYEDAAWFAEEAPPAHVDLLAPGQRAVSMCSD